MPSATHILNLRITEKCWLSNYYILSELQLLIIMIKIRGKHDIGFIELHNCVRDYKICFKNLVFKHTNLDL